MITSRIMTVDDYLSIMAFDKDSQPEFTNLTDDQKKLMADINILSGRAMSFMKDGVLFGVAGIRYAGLGEAWCACMPCIRQEQRFMLFREARKFFNSTVDELNLWKVAADCTISENFLKHLGFVKPEKPENTMIWLRR